MASGKISGDILDNYTQVGSTGIFYRKKGRLVEVDITRNSVTVTNQGFNVGTLPSNCRPSRAINFVNATTMDPKYPNVVLMILPDGAVNASAWSTVSTHLRAHICYLV